MLKLLVISSAWKQKWIRTRASKIWYNSVFLLTRNSLVDIKIWGYRPQKWIICQTWAICLYVNFLASSVPRGADHQYLSHNVQMTEIEQLFKRNIPVCRTEINVELRVLRRISIFGAGGWICRCGTCGNGQPTVIRPFM